MRSPGNYTNPWDAGLELALSGTDETNQTSLASAVAVVEPCAATARWRAERRALRLFVHAPECRELLQCLTLHDPACRAAMEWLHSLAVVAVDGSISGMALELAGQLHGAAGAELNQAAAPGLDVVAVVQREPQVELQALLDVLEPVAPREPASLPFD